VLHYNKLVKNKTRFLALTGLTKKEFQALLPYFQKAFSASLPTKKTLAGKKRKRAIGAGRKPFLKTIEDKLLFILVFQKSYPVQELLAATYDCSQSVVNNWIHRLLPVLKAALTEMKMMPVREGKKFASQQRIASQSTDLIVDGTERRRQRPKDKEQQKAHYSGKKKTHTDKNLIISEVKSKRIAYLGTTYVGQVHDKTMADTEAIVYPKETQLHQDTGFQGYAPKVKRVLQPKKTAKSRTETKRETT
jgi:DDE superfamily endonuclease/Helix-turn-helix of DDE superfamily endonuclease